jgi:hypothetical protein
VPYGSGNFLSDMATLPSEHLEQVRLVSWFRRQWPGVRIFAIPNGGGRSASQGASLRAEGVQAGIPDLFVPAWCLWVEMKRETGGVVSPVQRDWIVYLEGIGHRVIVGRGFEDAKRQILDVKKPDG